MLKSGIYTINENHKNNIWDIGLKMIPASQAYACSSRLRLAKAGVGSRSSVFRLPVFGLPVFVPSIIGLTDKLKTG